MITGLSCCDSSRTLILVFGSRLQDLGGQWVGLGRRFNRPEYSHAPGCRMPSDVVRRSTPYVHPGNAGLEQEPMLPDDAGRKPGGATLGISEECRCRLQIGRAHV